MFSSNFHLSSLSGCDSSDDRISNEEKKTFFLFFGQKKMFCRTRESFLTTDVETTVRAYKFPPRHKNKKQEMFLYISIRSLVF